MYAIRSYYGPLEITDSKNPIRESLVFNRPSQMITRGMSCAGLTDTSQVGPYTFLVNVDGSFV